MGRQFIMPESGEIRLRSDAPNLPKDTMHSFFIFPLEKL